MAYEQLDEKVQAALNAGHRKHAIDVLKQGTKFAEEDGDLEHATKRLEKAST